MKLDIKTVEQNYFKDLNPKDVLSYVNNGGIYLIKNFFSEEIVMSIREDCIDLANKYNSNWYPMHDDSPSYHNINNENKDSRCKQIVHRFQFHLWREEYSHYVHFFKDLFKLKKECFGIHGEEYFKSIPSSGMATIMGINHFPRGGGYMSEHVDALSQTEPIQTLIKASKNGEDFCSGGLHIRLSKDDEQFNFEKYWDIGDLIIMNSEMFLHGVSEIDPKEPLDWSLMNGRFTICLRTDDTKERAKVTTQV